MDDNYSYLHKLVYLNKRKYSYFIPDEDRYDAHWSILELKDGRDDEVPNLPLVARIDRFLGIYPW